MKELLKFVTLNIKCGQYVSIIFHAFEITQKNQNKVQQIYNLIFISFPSNFQLLAFPKSLKLLQ